MHRALPASGSAIRTSSSDDPADRQDGISVVPLQLSLQATVDLGRVPAAFGDEAGTWLGEPTHGDAAGLRRYSCDLRLQVSPDGHAIFRKSALVDLGEPRATLDGWRVPIEWRAATLAPLFPVFVGRLMIRADRIDIDGHYAPPFGVVGLVIDRAILSIVARGTARWFLAQVADALR